MAFFSAGPRIDFKLDPNTANPFLFTFTDEAGQAIDFTNSSFKLQAQAVDSKDDVTGSVLLTLSTGSGISGTLANGEFNVTFPKTGGLPAGRYAYTCLRISGGVAVEPHCWGFIDVGPGIAS